MWYDPKTQVHTIAMERFIHVVWLGSDTWQITAKNQKVSSLRLEKRSAEGLGESSMEEGVEGSIIPCRLGAGISNFSDPTSQMGSSWLHMQTLILFFINTPRDPVTGGLYHTEAYRWQLEVSLSYKTHASVCWDGRGVSQGGKEDRGF